MPQRYPTSLVLRHNKLWFDVPDEKIRRFLLGYLGRPQWRGKTWDGLKDVALVPVNTEELDTFFDEEAKNKQQISDLLNEVERLDQQIDKMVFDLYGITDPDDKEKIRTAST